jgi:phosphonate transport system ATP-binding protein
MDSLRAINRDLGITVICNLHSLDIARDYCTRLIGLTDGEVVFDGPPDALTDALVTRLYGLGAQQIDAGHAYATDLSGEKKAVQAFA